MKTSKKWCFSLMLLEFGAYTCRYKFITVALLEWYLCIQPLSIYDELDERTTTHDKNNALALGCFIVILSCDFTHVVLSSFNSTEVTLNNLVKYSTCIPITIMHSKQEKCFFMVYVIWEDIYNCCSGLDDKNTNWENLGSVLICISLVPFIVFGQQSTRGFRH